MDPIRRGPNQNKLLKCPNNTRDLTIDRRRISFLKNQSELLSVENYTLGELYLRYKKRQEALIFDDNSLMGGVKKGVIKDLNIISELRQ